jgi:putative ABC transport system ATP-binding protein
VSDGEPALELVGVTRTFAGDLTVLHGIDLRIERGELLAIVGPSGSGKSTLLNIMGTLDTPSTGTVRIAGADVGAMDDDQRSALRAREIGFVFQQFFLLDGRSARDNVADGLLYLDVPKAQRAARANVTLERVGLGHRLDARPRTLSGGERQRVAIARAVVRTPTLLLADEPTGNLDEATGDSVLELLRELHAAGTTVVVITHDHEVAASMPRVVEIRDGRIVSDGPPTGRRRG